MDTKHESRGYTEDIIVDGQVRHRLDVFYMGML
jgi:hypothetical protein